MSLEDFVADCLQRFEADPVNRDVAIASCLYYLVKLNTIGDALNAAMPQISAMSKSGILGKLGALRG